MGAHATKLKMSTAQGSILIKAPIASVYRRWLRFEDSPQFMTAVKEVEKLDANHFFMTMTCNGKRMEGVLEIMLRVPERRIAWRLVAGKSHYDHVATGVTSFTSQSDRSTRVNLKISSPTVGDDLSGRVHQYLRNFKRLVEDPARRKRATPLEA
jgi:uncharacterized membrane protein